MKTIILFFAFMTSLSSYANPCSLTGKRYLGPGKVLRLHNPFGPATLKSCLQFSIQTMQEGEFDDLMVQHTDKKGKITAMKIERSSAQKYEKYYLFD